MFFTDSLKHVQRRAFYDDHQFLAVLMIVVVLLFPFAGLLVNGLFGVIAGALISFVAYYVTPYVALKLGASPDSAPGRSIRHFAGRRVQSRRARRSLYCSP